MVKIFFSLLIGVLLCTVSNCKTIKDVRIINNTKVKTHKLTVDGKSIILTPLVHFGQKEFFQSLKDSIIDWKKNNYTVFFEEIKNSPEEMGIDLSEFDTILRKFRKITGGKSYTREHYAELNKTFPNAITQPYYPEIGIDSTDVNADITLKDFVTRYELLYGNLLLTNCDLNTPHDSIYPCEKHTNKLEPIIVDYRNEVVIQHIQHSEKNKIVVLYGIYHMKKLKRSLKKVNKLTRT